MTIPGNLLTTAMAVMPHKDIDRALEMALSLDVPFWPQPWQRKVLTWNSLFHEACSLLQPAAWSILTEKSRWKRRFTQSMHFHKG